MRTFFHILFSPIYLTFFVLAILFVGFVIFTSWLFEPGQTPDKYDRGFL